MERRLSSKKFNKMKEKNVIQHIADADINGPRLYSVTVEKDYGLLFYNNDNKDSYVSNHAVITNPKADLSYAVGDIVAFYHSHNQTPRLYQGYVNTEEELLLPLLRRMGFKIERNKNQMFVREPCGIEKLVTPKHPQIRRLRTIESGFCDILREDDGGDWNVKKWTRCILDPRVFAFAQPDENGDTVAIAALRVHGAISVIEDVVTAQSDRRRGFATSMLTQIIELHENMENGNPINLFADNPDAIRVYDRLGFKQLEHKHPLWLSHLEQDPN